MICNLLAAYTLFWQSFAGRQKNFNGPHARRFLPHR